MDDAWSLRSVALITFYCKKKFLYFLVLAEEETIKKQYTTKIRKGNENLLSAVTYQAICQGWARSRLLQCVGINKHHLQKTVKMRSKQYCNYIKIKRNNGNTNVIFLKSSRVAKLLHAIENLKSKV
jgi:hypothetical protein